MIRTVALFSLLLLAHALAPPWAFAEEGVLVGTVVDAEGEPLEGVEVATHWVLGDGSLTARQAVKTNGEGAFVLPQVVKGRSRSLLALDAARERGALVTLTEESAKEPLRLVLGPLTTVHGTLASKDLGWPLERSIVSVTDASAQVAFLTQMTVTHVSIALPPGSYTLMISAVDCERMRKRITPTAEEGELDLGTIDLAPTIIAQHYGKPPPALHATAARGVEPETTWEDWKGRWVLLEFWGHW